jgi:plastocyanin
MRRQLAAVLVVLAAAGCSGSQEGTTSTNVAPTSDAATVHLKLLTFTPTELQVKAGTTVTWRNDEPITHTVTSGAVEGVDPTSGLRSGEKPDGRFDGRLGGSGATFRHRFTEAGTYSYYCSIHQGMNATVVVTA